MSTFAAPDSEKAINRTSFGLFGSRAPVKETTFAEAGIAAKRSSAVNPAMTWWERQLPSGMV
jgi:hypothetical protein